MKKILAVLLCGCLMMGVAAGCGTERAETEAEKETADVRKIDGYYPFSTIHYMEGVDDVEEAPTSRGPAFPDKTRLRRCGIKAVPAGVPTPRTASPPMQKNNR